MGCLDDMSVTIPSMARSFQASAPNFRMLGGFNDYYENSVAINNHLPVAATPICHFKFPIQNNMHCLQYVRHYARLYELMTMSLKSVHKHLQTLLCQKKMPSPLLFSFSEKVK